MMERKNEDQKITVEAFQMEWPHLTKKQQEQNPLIYRYALNYIKSRKALEGFKAKRINQANTKGTKITFERMKTATEMAEYARELNMEYESLIEQIPELKAAVNAAREAMDEMH